MAVVRLSHEELLGYPGGRHFASEPHLRIQVLPIRAGQRDRDLFSFHGELLLLCLRGDVLVRTGDESHKLTERDQLLLVDGEPFAVESANDQESLVQFVWAPGPNPCGTCQQKAGQSGEADADSV